MNRDYQLSDQQIADAFKGTNYGNADLRKELAHGVLSRMCGLAIGGTTERVLQDLGMLTKKRNATKRGRMFCADHFHRYYRGA
ncbi:MULTISPECIES: hypothetical protein [Herbaspirillum]|uniref:Uncharacterized protein n=2 Tax=Herbaspirillum huttiense TaxID=863372 RepID=A0AAJ2LU28_9BURK|nr:MULTISPECIES: hypothetical protein [Herbaspirillum]MDR9836930.1 hypothetical protein [Herbaspirillum huttiense]